MSKKKVFMSVTASAVIASTLAGAEEADAASYKVKSGDTLWSISQKYDTSVAQLQSWNNLKNHIILPNQALEVGVGGKAAKIDKSTLKKKKSQSTAKSTTSQSKAKTKSKASTYTVKRGDTLSEIAYNHGISLKDLMAWNNLESTLIFPGDKFVVSKGAAADVKVDKPKKKVEAPAKKTEDPKKEKAPVKEKVPATDKAPVKEKDSAIEKAPTKDKPKEQASPSKPAVNEKPKAEKPVVVNPVVEEPIVEEPAAVETDPVVEEPVAEEPATEAVADPTPEKVVEQPAAPAPVSGNLIDTAKSALGTPYVWGGTTTSGFDCSGFIHWALSNSGTNMGRQSTDGYYNRSYIVNSPQVGDFVFFENTYKSGISHMGIYLGGNKFIHASTSQGVVITDLSNPYWSEHFHSYKRLY